MRFEDLLEEANNFIAWKLRIMMLLEECKLESYVKDKRKNPKDEIETSQWIKNNKKAMKLIVDSVRVM